MPEILGSFASITIITIFFIIVIKYTVRSELKRFSKEIKKEK